MNPLGFNYGTDCSLVPGFGKPSCIIVTGRGNRYFEEFQDARLNGGIVYQYYNTLNCPDDIKNPNDQEQYLINGERPPLWPFLDENGDHRTNWEGTKLLDIREGSPWLVKIDEFVRAMIARGHADGFFLDTLGWRPWSKTHEDSNGNVIKGADWETWPANERELWTRSCVNVARIVHTIRQELQPDFELVCNNVWQGDYAWATEAEDYLNGLCMENPPLDKKTGQRQPYHVKQAEKPWAGEPYRKRVLIIANTPKMLEQWKPDPNVTHITLVDAAQGQNYMRLTPAVVPYQDENPPPPCEEQLAAARETIDQLNARVAELEQTNADLTAKNQDLEQRMGQIGPHAEEIGRLAGG